MFEFQEQSLREQDISIHTACRLGNLRLISRAIGEDSKCINEKDAKLNWTPLFRCVVSSHEKAIELLLSRGADPNIANDNGESPLHQATENSQLGIASLLLNFGGNPNIQEEYGDTPLHNAVNHGDLPMVELLLQYKADPNISNFNFGRTPLHYAASKQLKDIVQVLVSNGADARKPDNNGKTPFLLAKDMEEIMESSFSSKELSTIEISEQQMNKTRQLGKLYYWLESIGMTQFYDTLTQHSYDDLDTMGHLKSQDLAAIGISKMADRYKMLIRMGRFFEVVHTPRITRPGCWAKCYSFSSLEQWLTHNGLEPMKEQLSIAGYNLELLAEQMNSDYYFTHSMLERELGVKDIDLRERFLERLYRDSRISTNRQLECNNCLLL